MSALLLVFSGWARGAETQSAAAVPFPVASVHFEQNATDGDMEVVFEVKGGDDGLAEFIVVSPDGRTIVDFNAPDSSTLGIRQFRFESPEPPDVESLKAAYPEGVYEFSGKTSSGAKLVSKATLSHRLPATTTFAEPAPAAENVSVKDLKISWSAVEGVASYVVEIDQDELNVNITALLPGSSTSFAIPDGFLLPGTEYQMGIGTVTGEGNISFVETTFTTEK
jgi:hypothetical protein